MCPHRLTALAVVGAVLCLVPAAARLPAQQAPAARIVAIGDIHGAADQFVEILQAAGLGDASGRWTGGSATFVQTGDYLDRGVGGVRVLDLLMAMEGQAKQAGGRAEILLGNHEVMNMLHEFTDVPAEIYAQFADNKSEDRRRKAFEQIQAAEKRSGGATEEASSREAWMAAHPPGFVEYVDAMSPRGKYGKWLRTRNAMAKVDTTVFMHAGLSPMSKGGVDDVNRDVEQAIDAWDTACEQLVKERLITPYSSVKQIVAAAAADLQKISKAIDAGQPLDARVTREYVDQLKSVALIAEGPLLSGQGPMWFRGLSQTPTEETDADVAALLSRLGATRMVVAHTPRLPGKITPRFNNRVFPIDTGMLTSFFKGGRGSALEIVGSKVTAIYVGERETLVEQ